MAPTFPGLLAAVVVAVSGTVAVAPPPPRFVESVTTRAINTVVDALASRRGVRMKRPLVVRVVDRPHMRAAREALAEPARAPASLRDEAELHALLGVEPAPDAELAHADGRRAELVPQDVTGLYDAPGGRLLIGSWTELGADRLAVDHDVALAVLDRRFDLRRWLGVVEPPPGAQLDGETKGDARADVRAGRSQGGAPGRSSARFTVWHAARARPTARPVAGVAAATDGDADARLDPGFDLQTDAALARQALIEGDAAVQALEQLDPGGNLPPPRALADVLAEVRATSAAESAALSPLALGQRLFLQLDGLAFVARIRAREPWSAVDAVWARPPQSTEQILHPDKYDRREAPDDVGARLPARLRGGFRVAFEDTLGELGARVFLARAGDDYRAERGATGWAGDRALLIRAPDAANAFAVWITTWDDPSDAEDFAAQTVRVLALLARAPAAAEQPGAEQLRVTDAVGRIYALDRRRRAVGLLLAAPAGAEAVFADLMSAVAGRAPPPARPKRAQGRVRSK